MTAVAYPADTRLAAFVDRVIRTSPRFADLWSTGTAGALADDRKIIEHPLAGTVHLDLEVLMVPDTDLRIVTYSAADGSRDARKLEELRTSVRVS